MVELFPQNERGLSLDVFLSREIDTPACLTMRVYRYDGAGTQVPLNKNPEKISLGKSPEEIVGEIQHRLNRYTLHLELEQVREVFLHEDLENPLKARKDDTDSLKKRLETLYATVRDYLIAAQTYPDSKKQTDSDPEIYRITFGQERIPLVTGR